MIDVKPEDIISVELGLINKCVLSCRLCLRQEDITKGLEKDVALDFDKMVLFLDKLPNLKQVDMVGSISEPTLHKRIHDIVSYVKARGIGIRFSTNGNTFSLRWWENFGKLFDEKDIIRFAVDGSTQAIHSKYRVKGKLSKVLACHTAFRKTAKATTVLQNILFDYNIGDQGNILDLYRREDFDICEFTHTGNSLFSEDTKLVDDNILPVKDLLSAYQHLDNSKSVLNTNIKCASLSKKQLYLNHLGCLLPCDDMEEGTFKDPSKNVTIYDNTMEECLAVVSNIINKRFIHNTCEECCGPINLKIRSDYPIVQYNRKGLRKELINFREVIDQ